MKYKKIPKNSSIRKIINNSFLWKELSEKKRIQLIINLVFYKYCIEAKICNFSNISITKCIETGIFFSLDQLMTEWKGSPLDDFEKWNACEIVVRNEKTFNDIIEFLNTKKVFSFFDPSIFGDIYLLLISENQRKSEGIFYTPNNVARILTQQIDQSSSFRRVLDPSCGCGNLLVSVYDYLADQTKNLKERHQSILEKEIWGFDLDETAVEITKITLALKCETYCFPSHIFCLDTLFDTEKYNEKFDLILCNPPYIGHKLIRNDYMEKLREKFPDVYEDKGNISYCFFKRSIELLKDSGQAVFVTSRYFLEAHNAEGLRDCLGNQTKINKIIDFNGLRIFGGIGVDPLILDFRKAEPEKEVNISKRLLPLTENEDKSRINFSHFNIPANQFTGKPWRLIDQTTERIVEKIEKYTSSSLEKEVDFFQGIITGLDRCFVIMNEMAEKEDFPQSLLYPWLKNRQIHSNYLDTCTSKIIYLDQPIDLEVYPELRSHFLPYYKKLSQRRECRKKKIQWYQIQWPRKKELFLRKKIVFPYKAEENRFAIDDQGCFFSADVYGMLPQSISEEAMCLLLNSQLYNFYYKSFAKKLGGALYEYYPNMVKRLKIPSLDCQLYCYFNDLYDIIPNNNRMKTLEKKADEILYQFFHLSQKEIQFVQSRTK